IPCASPAAQPAEPREQRARLPDPRSATVTPEGGCLEPVQLEELERLPVVPCGDLDLVATLAEQPNQRPEHEHVRRRGHVHPHPQAGTSTSEYSMASAARPPAAPSHFSGISVRRLPSREGIDFSASG